jgi:hypothetical protein
MKKIIGIVCVLILASCGNTNDQKNQSNSDTKNDQEQLKTNKSYSDILDNPVEIPESGTNTYFNNGSYERYLIVKGRKLNSPLAKIQDYADLPGRGDVKKEFGISTLNNWTIIKIPSDIDYYNFHNLTYWFLGYGEDDPNYADETVGIAFHNTNEAEDYIIYNDYSLREELEIMDDLFAIKKSNNQIIVSIPFDISLQVEAGILPVYEKVQINYGFNVNDIRNSEFENKTVLFNE